MMYRGAERERKIQEMKNYAKECGENLDRQYVYELICDLLPDGDIKQLVDYVEDAINGELGDR